MASFNLFNRLQTWFGDEGQLLAGGYFKFYEGGTTTPTDVYGDTDLAVNNGSTVALDASARLVHEVWGDASLTYFVELYDAANVKQGDFDHVGMPGGPAQDIPIPADDEYLGGDGTVFIAKPYTGLPDPTGQANKIISTDGVDFFWIAKPSDGEAGTSDTESLTNGFRVGSWQAEYGTGTGTNTGGRTQTATITFATTFTSAPSVRITPTVVAAASVTSAIGASVTSVTTTGCTVTFTLGEADDGHSIYDFNTAVSFAYEAVGKVS